jgi:carbon storage regulator
MGMLVLSRKENQSIQIGDDITIKVVLVAGRRVKLAIDAPRAVRVLRGELQADDRSAKSTSASLCSALDLPAYMAHAES